MCGVRNAEFKRQTAAAGGDGGEVKRTPVLKDGAGGVGVVVEGHTHTVSRPPTAAGRQGDDD